MSDYTVTLSVSAKMLPTLLGVIEKSKGIQLQTIKACDEEVDHRNFQYAGGKKNKGISSEALAIEVLADGKIKKQDAIQKEFVKRGFAESSAMTAMYALVRKKLAKRVGEGFQQA